MIERIPTYDEIQMSAKLVVCTVCSRSFYMTKPGPVCIECRQRAAKATENLEAPRRKDTEA